MFKISLVTLLLLGLSNVSAEEIGTDGMVYGSDNVITQTLEELTKPIPGEDFTPDIPSREVEYREVWFGSMPDQVVLVPVDEYEEYMENYNGSTQPLPEPDEGFKPSTPNLKWADDELIDGPFSTMTYPSIAVAGNGDIYAACGLNDGTYDYIRIYLSTDGGMHWSIWSDFSTPATAHRRRPHLLINDVGITEYIFLAYDIELSNGELNVWTVRSTLGAPASWSFASIDATSSTEDIHAVIDHDRYSPYYIYAAFQRNTGTDQGDIRASISKNEASSWETSYSLATSTVGEYRDPEIGYGYGGNVYVTWWLDGDATHDDAIRLTKGTNRPDSLNDWALHALTANNDGIDDREPSVAATSSGNNVEVMYRRYTSPRWDIYEHYSSDGGSNWNQGQYALGGDDGRTRWPRLYADHANVTLYLTWRTTYNNPPMPERYYVNSTTTPGSWGSSTLISDVGNEPSYAYPPAITVRQQLSPSEKPWVAWLKYDGNYWFYFDAGGFAGVSEEEISERFIELAPNPSNGMANLSYSVSKAGIVKISIYDISGRLIRNLIDETKVAGNYTLDINCRNLSSGVYFLHIITPDGKFTKSMTVVK